MPRSAEPARGWPPPADCRYNDPSRAARAGRRGPAMPDDIYQEIVRLRAAGRGAALATIIQVRGSIPAYECAKLLVRDDGSQLGTIGGGCVEAEVWQAAREVLREEQPRRLTFHLNHDAAHDQGLICGGTLEVFVEPILAAPVAMLFGAGHVSLALARAAALAGFEVVVVDDRAGFASRERFPEAAALHVGEFDQLLPTLAVPAQAYLLIVTRGHKSDLRVLRWALDTPARYIGMIGSRRKVLAVYRELEAEGVPRSRLAQVYAPLGLSLGAITPGEIAIATLAEMIAVRRRAPLDRLQPLSQRIADRLPSPALPAPPPHSAES